MKSEELMIGDFVTRQNYENKPVVCKIIGLSKNSISVEFDNGSRSMGASEDSINPIPLTPEILEKNGFVEITKRVKKLIWLWKKSGVLVEILEATPNIYELTIHYDYSDLSDQRIYVRHLHELQHALKLCRIIKTIEL